MGWLGKAVFWPATFNDANKPDHNATWRAKVNYVLLCITFYIYLCFKITD